MILKSQTHLCSELTAHFQGVCSASDKGQMVEANQALFKLLELLQSENKTPSEFMLAMLLEGQSSGQPGVM